MEQHRIYVCRTVTAEGDRDYVSLVSPEGGLVKEAIIGALRKPQGSAEPEITSDGFSRNGDFVDLLQAVIRREAPALARYRHEARDQGNGPVYVIDQRAAGQTDPIQPEDVFGAFVARNGVIDPESYEANPTHRILTERGFFRLEDELFAALIREIEACGAARGRDRA